MPQITPSADFLRSIEKDHGADAVVADDPTVERGADEKDAAVQGNVPGNHQVHQTQQKAARRWFNELAYASAAHSAFEIIAQAPGHIPGGQPQDLAVSIDYNHATVLFPGDEQQHVV